ncbi:TonB-dependent receptor plug domain-containing protein [Flagellimonas aequoris]|uniref:TonB-dependent receptor plug domain-containing protein n=1 Tax=Flagellimonas aequoris TaxID=2306997 RepID=A0A418N566_9FLAO|nr:TonB-dependent receptor plug domain-containing protein [Allomuricauda aequoris]RIV68889.1 hypothetical protein D2U88_17110 [Allomuricauda aequoris]TXK00593.1 hypothetical protein FQ019_16910 [Allomuricauda aequoris]
MRLPMILCILLCCLSVKMYPQADPGQLFICWDTSLSMMDRDVEKDFEFLGKAIANKPDQEIVLYLFGTEVVEERYRVQGGDWSSLKQRLENLPYVGATIYSKLNERIEGKKVYVFTDGNTLFKSDRLLLEKGSIIVNSALARNEDFLKRTALINRARLMDYASILDIGNRQKNANATSSLVTGRVYIDNVPSPHVAIGIKGTDEFYYTDAEGNFSIPAGRNDSLYIRSGEKGVVLDYAVSDMDNNKIFLSSKVVALDEVVLVEERKEKLVTKTTAYGDIDEKRVGVAIQTIGEDEITDINTNVSTVVQNRFSGVEVKSAAPGQEPELGLVKMRTDWTMLGNNYGLVVVNGIPMEQSGSGGAAVARFNFLDPNSIASITVLKGLAATNKYGEIGRNGVLLITTKTAKVPTVNEGQVEDRARLKNNVYDKEERLAAPGDSPFYNLFAQAENLEESFVTYLSLRSLNLDNTKFYLDSYAFFAERDKTRAAKVITDLWELHPDDGRTLKMVELCLSQLGKNELAALVNDQILELDGNNIMAQYNKAHYLGNGSPKGELDALIALRNRGQGFQNLSTSLISKTLDRDIKNLIHQKGGQMDMTQVDPKYQNNVMYDARFVFEWNNPEAEFEIQFVNPQNRFFNWEYSNAKPERIKQGIEEGLTIEEFEFYGQEAKGNWVVNAKFLENLSETDTLPLVLKCHLYTNFGKPNQKEEQLVVYFTQPNEKRNIKSLHVN